MGDLENKIIELVTEELKSGCLEELFKEEFRKQLEKSIQESFGRFGGIKRAIEKKIDSVMVPYIEKSDFTEFLPKLDTVLLDVINHTSIPDNKKILSNFEKVMCEGVADSVSIDSLFKEWMKIVASEVDTTGLEISFDDGPHYEDVEVSYEVEEDGGRSWSCFRHANIYFACEHDGDVNIMIHVSRYEYDKKEGWDICFDKLRDISSLRYLNDFEVLLMQLERNGTKLIIESDSQTDYVTPDKEPEPSFS